MSEELKLIEKLNEIQTLCERATSDDEKSAALAAVIAFRLCLSGILDPHLGKGYTALRLA